MFAWIRTTWPAAVALAVAAGLAWRGAGAQESAAQERLFELRVYTTHEGKLDDLHKRFREHTNELFVKHGMELVAYWTPTDGEKAENTLIYVLAYPNAEARGEAWQGFINDPDWKAAYAASRAEGPIVSGVESTLMQATDYSPLK